MKFGRAFLGLVLVLMLSSCVSMDQKWDRVNSDLDSWMHANEDELYTTWGPPQASSTLSNKNRIVSYGMTKNVTSGGYNAGNIWVPQNNSSVAGKVLFTISPTGEIVNWSFDGSYGPIRDIVRARPGGKSGNRK